MRAKPRRSALPFALPRILSPSNPRRGLGTHNINLFGTQSRGLHIRCLRFVITVARVQRYDHARLASGVAVFVVAGGILTPGCSPKFRFATSVPPLRPGLAWRTARWLSRPLLRASVV